MAVLKKLKIRGFRNLAPLDWEVPETGAAVVGPNGAGKTNLLEAIGYLEVFRSFRGAADRDLVAFDQDVFRVEAEVEGGGRVAAAYDRKQRIKKVQAGGLDVQRVSDALGRIGISVFRLEDLSIIRNSPVERRRFLDIALALESPGYVRALQNYRAALVRRNEALRRDASEGEIDAWTDGLVDAGALVTRRRGSWIQESSSDFVSFFAHVSGGEGGVLAYAPSGPDDAADFREALDSMRSRERAQGATAIGPHRDDFRFITERPEGSRDLRVYGSSGQQRTAVLALRLAEAERLRRRLAGEPVYLLDDIFAELDDGRSNRLLELFGGRESAQLILTSSRAEEGPRGARGLPQYEMSDGELIPA
ncbi:MAG: DNA replication and repair protein RecF [Gemmatimonadetes bacterium]|nr:DNA replication and repair protein RecF [Gemmatimonadota bacterium]